MNACLSSAHVACSSLNHGVSMYHSRRLLYASVSSKVSMMSHTHTKWTSGSCSVNHCKEFMSRTQNRSNIPYKSQSLHYMVMIELLPYWASPNVVVGWLESMLRIEEDMGWSLGLEYVYVDRESLWIYSAALNKFRKSAHVKVYRDKSRSHSCQLLTYSSPYRLTIQA